MVVSTRALVAMGLGLVGLSLLVGPTLAQQQDAAVRKTTSQGTAAPAAPGPATFGTIDMTAVFKNYDKVKVSGEEFKAAVLARQKELMDGMQEMKRQSEMMAKLVPNSVDFKKCEDRISQLKAENEANREKAEREFSLREAEMLATLYKEIQSMVTRVAKHKHITYILRVSNEPVTGSDPNSAMRAIERSIVYADPQNDITTEVINYLNIEYKQAGGVSPKSTTTSAAPAATKPRGN